MNEDARHRTPRGEIKWQPWWWWGMFIAGTLLRGASSLLAHNEHLPCEMVVLKLFPSLNYWSFSSKCALIALSGESGEGPLMERLSFRVPWQGDCLIATLAVLIWINLDHHFSLLYVNESQLCPWRMMFSGLNSSSFLCLHGNASSRCPPLREAVRHMQEAYHYARTHKHKHAHSQITSGGSHFGWPVTKYDCMGRRA